MNSPIALVPKPTAADDVKESVVRILRDTLAEAERGNVDCIIMIVGHPDGDWSDRCSATNRISEAIGRIEITKQDWIKEYLKNRG